MTAKRFAVLASGAGTNLQSIIDHWRNGHVQGELALVLSNKPESGALERARRAGIPHDCLDHRHYVERSAYDQALDQILTSYGIELVVLSGFLRILTPEFVRKWHLRLVNIHPALLPSFPGLHAVHQALKAGVRVTGVTVHFVDEGVDTGPIIAQEAVRIYPSDTEASLLARLHPVEHTLYPRCIDAILRGAVAVDGRHVTIQQ